jgi:hypothetical protein
LDRRGKVEKKIIIDKIALSSRKEGEDICDELLLIG